MVKIGCPKCNLKVSGKNIVRDVNSNLFSTNHEMDGTRSFTCFFWNKVRIFITEQTGFKQRRILRALTKVRLVMTKDIR